MVDMKKIKERNGFTCFKSSSKNLCNQYKYVACNNEGFTVFSVLSESIYLFNQISEKIITAEGGDWNLYLFDGKKQHLICGLHNDNVEYLFDYFETSKKYIVEKIQFRSIEMTPTRVNNDDFMCFMFNFGNTNVTLKTRFRTAMLFCRNLYDFILRNDLYSCKRRYFRIYLKGEGIAVTDTLIGLKALSCLVGEKTNKVTELGLNGDSLASDGQSIPLIVFKLLSKIDTWPLSYGSLHGYVLFDGSTHAVIQDSIDFFGSFKEVQKYADYFNISEYQVAEVFINVLDGSLKYGRVFCENEFVKSCGLL